MPNYLLSFLFILVAHLSISIADDPNTYVQIQTGNVSATIKGYIRTYGYSFRGIRYAVPPLASNRFKNAQRMDPTGSIDALAYGSQCMQFGSGSEDCLFLNVFSPLNTSPSSKLPVYVYIHGGGFVQGNGNQGAGIYDDLVNRGPLVMVSINYRLGPYGFFSTRDAMAPGNFAVSDWIEALNWVQRYISFFGGDPTRVTVGGQSSGAEAVSFISLTPKALGLYSQLILESGSAFGAAVMSYSEQTRNTSNQLATKLGCCTDQQWASGTDFGPIMNCMRSIDVGTLGNADNALPDHRMKWSVVQDKTYFTDRLEYLALQRPPVPVLIGDVHDEWLAFVQYDIDHNLNSPSHSRQGLTNTLTTSYEMTYWDNSASVLQGAKQQYIDNQNIPDNDHTGWMAQQILLYSDMVFIGPVFRDAKYFAFTKSNVYLYSWDYVSPNALPDIQDPRLRGVPHAYELQYLYDNNCEGFTCTNDDNTLRTVSSKCWTNFIVGGDPAPANSGLNFRWPKLDQNNRFISMKPYPSIAQPYHPTSVYWACTAPTIDGYKPPFC